MGQKQETYKPGDSTPHSGKYDEVGPKGGTTGDSCVSVVGRPLPPTNQSGNGWKLVDPSGDK
jgi:hypothetical protein